jgi:hypothetical protein
VFQHPDAPIGCPEAALSTALISVPEWLPLHTNITSTVSMNEDRIGIDKAMEQVPRPEVHATPVLQEQIRTR